MTRSRLAIIGLGMAVTPHAKSLIDLNERVDVVGAFSPTAERRRKFGERFPFPLVDDVERIWADKSIAAVSILTPPNTHLDLVRRAAETGKHVLLEKPLEVTTGRSREVVDVCRAAGVKLGVVLQHRFRPPAKKLREALAAKELGSILDASTAIRVWRPQSYYDQPGRGTKARDGGGVLLTQAIHTLDLFLSLVGQPDEVTACVTTTPIHRMETEDLVSALVRFRNGAFGTIDATTAAYPGYPERIELIGEKGCATIEGTGLAAALQDGRTLEISPDESAGGTGADPMAFPHDYHRELIADFLDAIEKDRSPRVNGEEALKVHFLIDAVLESGATGRPVTVREK